MTSRWTVAQTQTSIFFLKKKVHIRWMTPLFQKKAPDCDIHHDLFYSWKKIFEENIILKYDWTKKKILQKWKNPKRMTNEIPEKERGGRTVEREGKRLCENIELFSVYRIVLMFIYNK